MSELSNIDNKNEKAEKKAARDEAIRDVKMYMANDWEMKEETPEYFLLTRNNATTTSHIILFCCTCYFFGIPNIIYHFMKKEKKKIVK